MYNSQPKKFINILFCFSLNSLLLITNIVFYLCVPYWHTNLTIHLGFPNITEFGGKYYIYPTTDGTTGWMSTYFTCWSSKDLVKWKNEGTILDLPKDVPWGPVCAWAPCAVQQKGKYYFYFSAAQSIGVAVSDKPTGPFKDALGKPLVEKGKFECQSIDPMVLIDNDGAAYLYFGQGKCMMVKLNDDMISFNKADVKNITLQGYKAEQ